MATRKKVEKTLAQQQLEAFTGVGGKEKAVAFFHSQMPRLAMHYDHQEEALELLSNWEHLAAKLQEETNLEVIGEVVIKVKRLVEMVYGENTREVVMTHWNGDLMELFNNIK